ncbi:MAG TPA: hypothetical protein VJS92_18455, partial [Candidatus Polarisedimenticolaceae bacterium]|nr:hypothetical protein [Candidatus Polarisedimenticolaceae bacterium]
MPPPEISIGATPLALCRELLSACPCALLLDGAGGFADAWTIGPLVALAPRLSAATGLAEIDRLHAARRAAGGSAATGL